MRRAGDRDRRRLSDELRLRLRRPPDRDRELDEDRLRRRELRDDALRAAGLRDRFLLATARPNESTDRDLSRRMRRREPSLLS